MGHSSIRMVIAAKSVLWLVLLAPAAWLGWQIYILFPPGVVCYIPPPGPLSVEPHEFIVRFFGEWGLRILLLSLALTPLACLLKISEILLLRRLTGLFALAYLSTHFMLYVRLLPEAHWVTVFAGDFVEVAVYAVIAALFFVERSFKGARPFSLL